MFQSQRARCRHHGNGTCAMATLNRVLLHLPLFLCAVVPWHLPLYLCPCTTLNHPGGALQLT